MLIRLPTIVLIGMTCLAIVAIVSVGCYPRHPYLLVDHPVIDLGTMKQGVSLETEFHLRNQSGRPLKIVDVITDCRCSSVDGFTRTLESGEETNLRIRIDTAGYRGTLLRKVRVLYRHLNSDAPISQLTLAIRSNIVPEFTVEPSVLTFRDGVSSIRSVRLLSERSDFFIESTYATNVAFSVEAVDCQAHICTLWIRFTPMRWTKRRVPGDVPRIVIRTNSVSEPVHYLDANVVP